MTFTQNVKNELLQIRENTTAKKHILFGFAYCMKTRGSTLVYSAESEQVLIFLKKLLGKYSYNYNGKQLVANDEELRSAVLPSGGDYEAGLFLRGVFLAAGVISNPRNSYHLEINGLNEAKCDELSNFLREQGIPFGKSIRKNRNFLYLKESERIADFLTYIGAAHHSMEIMNVKIFKEVRNNINRTVNCEAANIEKTARAASRQLADIELIYNLKGEFFLPAELRAVAELRLNNIEMSLQEIGDACEPKISRSGVNHRLRKINQIAESLRESNKKRR